MFVVVKDLTQYVCNYATLNEAIMSVHSQPFHNLSIFKLDKNGLPILKNKLEEATQ
jgi:hypothetical protein